MKKIYIYLKPPPSWELTYPFPNSCLIMSFLFPFGGIWKPPPRFFVCLAIFSKFFSPLSCPNHPPIIHHHHLPRMKNMSHPSIIRISRGGTDLADVFCRGDSRKGVNKTHVPEKNHGMNPKNAKSAWVS